MRHPRLRGVDAPGAKQRPTKAVWLGRLGGAFSRLFQRRLPPVGVSDLRAHDYPTSTQRMGLRFTDRIRDTFRFRWLKRTR